MQTLDWLLVGGYTFALLALVISVRRAKSLEDYAVASREMPGPILLATLAATFVGPGYSMGLAGKASQQGFVWLFIFSGFALQMFVVGRFISPAIQGFRTARTIPEIIGRIYGPATRCVATILTLSLLIGFVGVISRAAAELISGLTDLSITQAAIVSCLVVIAYSSFGGIKADILLDVLHFVLLGVAVPLLLIMTFVNGKEDTTLSDIVARAGDAMSVMTPLAVASAFAGFLLGEALIPPYVARALAARSPEDARRGFQLAALFGIAWFLVCASIGFMVAGIAPDDAGDGAFLYAMKSFLPVGMLGLVTVALIGIILSSWDSLLNCASVSFSVDLLPLFIRRGLGMRETLVSSQILSVVIGVGALTFALRVPGIVEALMYCYTLWAPTVVLPLAIGVLKRNISPYSGMAAIVVGAITTGFWEWGLDVPFEVPSLVVGVLANQGAFWLTHMLIRHRPTKGLFAPQGDTPNALLPTGASR